METHYCFQDLKISPHALAWDLWIVAADKRLFQAVAIVANLPKSVAETLPLVIVGGI